MRKSIVLLVSIMLTLLLASCSKPVPLKILNPVVTPAGGSYAVAQNVTVTCPTADVQIRYTLDGTEPTNLSDLYTAPINLPSSKTLKVKAFKSGWTDSDTVTHTYYLPLQLTLSKCWGGTGSDALYDIAKTSDSGSIAAGATLSTDGDTSGNHGKTDGWIIKTDADGIKVWSKVFGGSEDDFFNRILQTSDGGYIAVGRTTSNNGDISGNQGNFDGWIIKVDASGNKLWSKCFGGSEDDFFNRIIQTADGGYIVVGFTGSNNGDISGNQGNFDGWIIKIDASGNKLWSKCFGGTDFDYLYSIVQTSDSGYVVVGETESNNGDISDNHGVSDGWLMKVDATGNKVWSKVFGGTKADDLKDIIQTSDGGYIAVGKAISTDGDILGNLGNSDGWIIKFNSAGDKVWSKVFGGSDYDYLYSIVQSSDGGYIAVGDTKSNNGDISANHGDRDGWIIKTDADGIKLWSKVFGGSGTDILFDIAWISDFVYITAGQTQSTDGDISDHKGNSDGWISKFQ
ncbi:MAG TPA: chitobiase/beta-hexosaminidase C-terminal domain-containing protein [Petrotogaceae bacterium]|nr:chitobiase/beta-hexosaminidase C-terminal domain-containing protein [Petrotogaceae bacterium]